MEANEKAEYPESILKMIEELEQKKNTAIGLKCAAIAADAATANIKPAAGQSIFVTVEVDPVAYNGVVILVMNPSPGTITEILRRLADLGYRQAGEPLDIPHLKEKHWNCGEVKVIGDFWKEKANCRYVQVGVEEKPVYELQCDD